ncbi:ORF6N domain-containing protein [Serratia bockelmannii]|uniref:ORF6N domain-containing protein n=1 Tax=Serratia TaxID=613 RepID=UPI002240407B|nr:ORF6N domain-containing protein [Serratia bockelmannii]BEN05088.1 antirepressor [Serratia marcescens]MCW7646172.1 ORF6N domain-containing protein [Serratia bockelmannii]MCW7655957.1 ORF6N domain-containing protein [Serratia bockelmannii]MCW7675742.1 ORF6N domain-containing protein [Serratia bockelmannii]MCW7680520.1 ORF6N domain-containing protein [Serratia bockelmannii]
MAKKTELMAVEAKDLQIVEYRGQRVVTTEQMAAGYGTDVANIKVNYSRNANRFVEGKHFFKVVGKELADLRVSFSYLQISSKTRSLMLWTERGAANHAKMLETDQAWSYYDEMVEFYFTRREALPAPADLSKLEILQLAIESEKGRLAEKERADHAERTKSQISRKREASALGKLSAATRKCRALEERLGESVKHATITKVEKKTGGVFKFAALRKWCKERGVTAVDVPDPRYGSVKSWPAGAWLGVYGVDLSKIFGGEA